jgi:predicted amidophosphoribosyltransferase
MYKIKIVKKVRPELEGFLIRGKQAFPLYRCPECGASIADKTLCCPVCRLEFKWPYTFSVKDQCMVIIKKILRFAQNFKFNQ